VRNSKFQLNWYQASDTAAMERKLEAMAERGWQLEKLNNWGFRYVRSEAKRTRYSVTFFPKASVFDAAPTQEQQTYADYCQAAGWEPVGNWGPLQIFRSTREDPTPIETDEGEKLQAIHKSMLKTQILAYGLLLAVWIMNLFLRLSHIQRMPLTFFSSNRDMGLLAFLVCFIGYMVYMVTDHFVWYFRSKKAVEQGGGCLPTNTGLRFWLSMVLLAVCAALVLLMAAEATDPGRARLLAASFCGMAAIMAASQLVLHGMKKRGFSRQATRAGFLAAAVVLGVLYSTGLTAVAMRTVTMEPDVQAEETYMDAQGHRRTIYSDALPVALEDLGYTVTENDHASSRRTVSRSILMTDEECVHIPYGKDSDLPELDYRVSKSKHPWVLKLCWRYLKEFESRTSGFKAATGGPWGAEDAFFHRAPDGLCLLYEDRIIIANTWDQFTEAQQMQLLELLKNS